MSYSTDLARLLTEQLRRLTTLKRHQLAGQAANLDFWMTEARHCFRVLDGYHNRFSRMKQAERDVLSEELSDRPVEDRPRTPLPPRSVPDEELKTVRLELREAAYRFLIRCAREKLISETEARQHCSEFDMGLESDDF